MYNDLHIGAGLLSVGDGTFAKQFPPSTIFILIYYWKSPKLQLLEILWMQSGEHYDCFEC